MINYTEKQINELMDKIYSGVITIDNLPKDLYIAISNKFVSALDEIEGNPSKVLLDALKSNIYSFSGAKVYQQINDISLLKDEETIKTFADFKEEALKIYDQYNVNWMRTEYGDAITQGQNAVRWEQIQDQKKTLPFLTYVAVLDSQTSEICEALDGVCLPADDDFWLSNFPQNHNNCRCVVTSDDEQDAVVTEPEELAKVNEVMKEEKDPSFNNNVGASKEIWPDTHPYFDIPE